MGEERIKLVVIDKDSLSDQTRDSSETSHLGLSHGPHSVFGLPSTVFSKNSVNLGMPG